MTRAPSNDLLVKVSEAGFHCAHCGYDVRGLLEARCPECGHRFTRYGLLHGQRSLRLELWLALSRQARNHPNVLRFVIVMLLVALLGWLGVRPNFAH